MPVVKVTSVDDAVTNMQQAFNTFWATQTIRPKITYDNTQLDVAKTDLSVSAINGESYVLLQIVHNTGEIAALGTNLHRQQGIMQIVVYVDTNTGRQRAANAIADQALNFLQTQLISGVTLQNQRMNEVGVSGKWWQVNVLADFIYDINRS